VRPGQRYRIAVQAESLGSYLDGVLRITDQAGKQIALADDTALPAAPGQQPVSTADPSVDVTAPADATLLVVELRDQRGRGGGNFGYRLTVEPTVPDFALLQPPAEVDVPPGRTPALTLPLLRGGPAALTVPVVRRGHTGPIRLTVPDLPPGLTVNGGHVPAGGNSAILTLSAAADTSLPTPLYLAIEGRATSEGKEVRRRAEQH